RSQQIADIILAKVRGDRRIHGCQQEQRNQPARVHSMNDVRPFPKTDMPSEEPIKALLFCPNCNVEMCLFGIEAESAARDLYTFECSAGDVIEVRGVRVNKTPPVVVVGKLDTL